MLPRDGILQMSDAEQPGQRERQGAENLTFLTMGWMGKLFAGPPLPTGDVRLQPGLAMITDVQVLGPVAACSSIVLMQLSISLSHRSCSSLAAGPHNGESCGRTAAGPGMR